MSTEEHDLVKGLEKRVFEKDKKGLLKEIDPKKADEVLKGRAVRHMHASFYVVMTPEEEAAFNEEQRIRAEKKKQRMEERRKRLEESHARSALKKETEKELMEKIRELQERLDKLEQEDKAAG